MIPLVDLKRQYLGIKNEIDTAIMNTVEKADFVMGSGVKDFENEMKNYCKVKNALGVSNGTSALRLALTACGVKQGDEVITVSNTFAATAEAIAVIGATPRFVDVDEKTFNIDPEKIEEAINEKTKAIMPVDLYGQPCEYDRIKEIADKHGLKIIEDACQAHGSEYKGKPVGNNSDIACFSFYPGKNLGCYGDGGMIVTNDEEMANKIELLRDHGRTSKYVHEEIGYNERLDTIQASILRVKLKHLDNWNNERIKKAHIYNDVLNELVACPSTLDNSKHVYHLFVVKTENRDDMLNHLNRKGIMAGIHYPIPLHMQKAFSYLPKINLPVTEILSKKIISLPIFPEITEQEIELVKNEIHNFLKNR